MVTVTSKRLYEDRCVLRMKHKTGIFAAAKEALLQYNVEDKKQIWVENDEGQIIYALEYYEDRLYDSSSTGVLFDRFGCIDLISDFDTLDLDIIKSNELFIFTQIEEYTYLIAKLIAEKFPQKKIVFLDKNALFFLGDSQIHVCDSIYDAISMGGKHVIITSASRLEQSCVPDALSKIYNSINMLYNLVWCRKVEHLGSLNPDKTILLLDYPTKTGGLGDIMRFTCTYLMIAEEKGWIPVVDLSKKPNQYLLNETDNAWEYFFEPVSDISVAEARRSRNVISASTNGFELCEWRGNLLQRKYDVFLNKTCGKKIIFNQKVRLNCSIKNYISENLPNELKDIHKKVLGVIARGSDYRRVASEKVGRTRYSASIESIAKRSEELIRRYGFDYIFLATEDEEYLQVMKCKFGDRLLYIDQNRVSYDYEKGEYCEVADILNMENGKEFGKKYLFILYCLSICDGLISSINCGASFIARNWNNGAYLVNENVEV